MKVAGLFCEPWRQLFPRDVFAGERDEWRPCIFCQNNEHDWLNDRLFPPHTLTVQGDRSGSSRASGTKFQTSGEETRTFRDCAGVAREEMRMRRVKVSSIEMSLVSSVFHTCKNSHIAVGIVLQSFILTFELIDISSKVRNHKTQQNSLCGQSDHVELKSVMVTLLYIHLERGNSALWTHLCCNSDMIAPLLVAFFIFLRNFQTKLQDTFSNCFSINAVQLQKENGQWLVLQV